MALAKERNFHLKNWLQRELPNLLVLVILVLRTKSFLDFGSCCVKRQGEEVE